MPNKTLTSRRILTLDLLRGWFLVAILLDHLQYYPNGFDLLTGRGDLYVSAAEGFFLISGIVLGVVRGRKLLEKPFKVAAKLLLKRGVQLYITAIVLFFVFTFIGWNFMDNPGLKPGIRPIDQNFFDILKGALNFDYIYGWADYLRLYAIYLFVSPIVVWLLRKGLWYVVAIASIGVWFYYDSSTLPTNELSQVYSWQTIFFGGMIIGFYIDQIKDWWHHRSKVFRKWATASVLAVDLITVIANI
ncbi:MAG: OpgC domain-containing protein, partial [Candidatus Saccharimonas sp.]